MKILLVAATTPEIAPTLTWLANQPVQKINLEISVAYTGVGVLQATHFLARYLASNPLPDMAIQGGVAGAISLELKLGTAVQVISECLMDAGAEDADGALLSNGQLGFPPGPPFDERGFLHPVQPGLTDLVTVAGGTVSLTTGTEATFARTRQFFPNVAVETMEGAPFFYSCMHSGIPCLQLRGISNYVGVRDRSSWKITEAVRAVNQALKQLLLKIASSPRG